MRELKFDVIIQIKHPVGNEISFEHNPFSEALHEGFVYFKDGELVTDEEDDDHKTILRQYIGRKDMNGNRIFEGDILHFNEIEWGGKRGSVFAIEWNDKLCGFEGNGTPHDWTTWCEVVGNIWETPQLLAGEK